MVVVHGQVHAAAGDAGLVREDGQRGLVLAVVPPVRARRCLYMWKSNFGRPTPSTRRCLCVCSISIRASTARATRRESAERPRRSIDVPAGGDAASPPGDLGDMIRNDTFNNLAALCRRGSLPRNGPSPPPQ